MQLVFILLTCWSYVCQAQPDNFQLFEEGGKMGLKNSQGVVVIPASYEALGWSDNSFSLVARVTGYKLNGKWGLISLTNKQVTAPQYDRLIPGDGQYILASTQSPATFRITTGCLSADGKIIIPFAYTGIKLHGMRAVTYTVDKDNQLRYGLITLENKTLLPALYQNIYPLGSLRYAVQNNSGKTALFDENGKAITGFDIDSIAQLKNDKAIFYQNGLQGLINRDGTIIKEAVYQEIKNETGKWYGRFSNEWVVLSSSNLLIKKTEGDSIVRLSHSRYKLVTAQGSRLLDDQLNPVKNAWYQSIGQAYNNMAVVTNGGKSGVTRVDGTIILPTNYDEIIISNTHLFVKSGGTGSRAWSLYDFSGNRISKKYYQHIEKFNDKLFRVTENGFQGAITSAGTEQIACVFDSLVQMNENLVVVKFKGQYGIISDKEEWVVPPQQNPIRLISPDRFLEQSGNLVTLKALNGNVLYFTTNNITIQKDMLVENVTGGGKWTINMNGQIISRELPASEQTELVWPATEGLRMIKRNGRYGFIDSQARLMIPNRYEEARPFTQGLAPIKIRDKWGFINHDDRIAVQPVYEEVSHFNSGYCVVKQNSKYGLINTTAELLLPARYDELIVMENRRILLKSEGLYGLASAQGDVLLFPKYDSVTDLNNGFVIVSQHGKYGLVDINGITTIPLIYDFLFFNSAAGYYVGLVKKSWQELK